MIVTALIFGMVGIYLLAQSGALGPDEVLLADAPERGLVYDGKKVKTKGPCKGGFDVTSPEEERAHGKGVRTCEHLDPTPPGIDIRQREKKVDENLASLAAHDEKVKPAPDDNTSTYEQTPLETTAETISGANMNGIGARNFPCYGSGADGARIHFVYIYAKGNANRISSLRPGFNAIAKRVTSIFYSSGYDSGNAHKPRFATNNGNADCAIRIPQEAVAAQYIKDHTALKSILKARGYDSPDRKYMMWIDGKGACGLGSLRIDSRPGQDNANNISTTSSYASVWKACWNYGEPHEIMHMLGGVQPDAPYATPGYHCRDDNDVMCYKDADNVNMIKRCTATIALWRYDCGKDTYYRGVTPTSGYLSNHWNTANSRFLTR
jgi:hypothetical protein